MKSFSFLVLSIVLAFSACGTPSPTVKSETLTVFAAASLTDAFSEIGEAFEKANPGVTIELNFAGSQSLRTQIEQGAQADVFASANTKEMNALVAGNLVAANRVRTFLTNRLVVIMPVNNPAGIMELTDLMRSGLKLILAAKEVPVGNYSLQVLDKLDQDIGNGFKDRVLANVVSYENDVKQVVAKVQLGEADAGMVYSSDTVAAPELQKIEIPANDNIIAEYLVAMMNRAQNPDLAGAFIDYVLSESGQAILQKWGFSPAK